MARKNKDGIAARLEKEKKDNYLVRVLLFLRTSFRCVWGVPCAREKSERSASQSKEGKATRNGSDRSSHRLDVPAVNVNWAEVLEDIDFSTNDKSERLNGQEGESVHRGKLWRIPSHNSAVSDFLCPGLEGSPELNHGL